MKELFVEARPENTEKLLDFTTESLTSCSPKTQRQIKIAVDEIFSNIVKYAYNPKIGGVAVRVSINEDVTIEFEDTGVAYDPLAADDPDTTLPIAERQIGGLGMFMMKNIMDSVEYRREGDKNILKIRKGLG